MARFAFTLITPLLLIGCLDQAPPQPTTTIPSAAPARPVETPMPLAEARRGFKTNLIQKESAAQPLPTPPSVVLQVVEFQSPVGKLGAYLSPDPGDGRKHPAIIWIHGGDCSTIDQDVWRDSPPSNDQTARQYREAGIVTTYPSLRGGNENPGFHEGFYGEVDDVLAAAEFLSTNDFVDPQRIYLGGHSSGATMVLLAAECSTRFRAVFSICPTDDIRSYPPQFKTFETSNDREFELRAPGHWLGSIRVPVFVFTGTINDGAFPAVYSMARSSRNPKVKLYPVIGANHFDIVAPTNKLIADKILADTTTGCNIAFTQDELDKPFKE